MFRGDANYLSARGSPRPLRWEQVEMRCATAILLFCPKTLGISHQCESRRGVDCPKRPVPTMDVVSTNWIERARHNRAYGCPFSPAEPYSNCLEPR
jgi:hypothetical protein